jgi:hypothetical protein
MYVYIYKAELYCKLCGERIKRELGSQFDTGDSEDYPQGPYPNSGGEADSPHHCGNCGEFLETPLTPDGYEYVRDVLESYITSDDVLSQWYMYYGGEIRLEAD